MSVRPASTSPAFLRRQCANSCHSPYAPTGLSSPVDKDRQDFTIYRGGWAMGRIYEQRGGPDSMRWFWSLHRIFGKPGNARRGHGAVRIDLAAIAAWAKLREDT